MKKAFCSTHISHFEFQLLILNIKFWQKKKTYAEPYRRIQIDQFTRFNLKAFVGN